MEDFGMKKIVTVCAALLACVGMAFAGGQQGGAKGAAAAPAASGAKKISVRYIVLQKGNPYFDPIVTGMKEAVESQGGVFSSAAPEKAQPDMQSPLIDAAVQDKVNVIVISPTSADLLNPYLDKARAAGVTVLMVNDDITGNESHRDAAVLSCDYDDLAVASFEQFAKAMDYNGNFVVLSSTTEAPFQNNQIAIYKKQMASNPKYSGLKLLEVLYGNDDPQKSLTETEAAIQKYPDLKGIIAPTTVGVIAAAQVVDSQNLKDKIVVTGLGTPSQSKAFLDSGVLKGAMLWDTYRAGKVAGYLAMLVAQGKYKIQPGTSFNAGEYGATKVGDLCKIIAGPPALINKDNVDSYKF
jgi:rhamnose transport system substrate-binding protein